MAKPTALTEAGGAKVALLANSTAVTPDAKGFAAVETAASGEATYPVGWQGVATHRQGQALTAAGGFTTDGAGPVVLVAGLQSTTVRALTVDSSGRAIIGQLIPGNAAADLGKAEDAIHATGDTGVMSLAVRKDTAAGVAADGDYHPLEVDATGKLWVNTGGGGGQSYTDKAAYTVSSDQHNPIGVMLDDTAPSTLAEGQAGIVRATADRAMHISVRDSAGNNRGVNVNASNQLAVSVDNTVTVATHAVTQSGTWNIGSITTLPALVTGSAAIGKLAVNDAVDIGDVTINNGAGAAAVNIQDGGNAITVDGTVAVSGTVTVGTHAVTQSGTWNVGTLTTVTNDVPIHGPAANDAATKYLNVRVTDGTGFGLRAAGWDQGAVAVQRGTALGVTATTDQTALAADASNIYNVMDVSVTIFAGTAAPAAKAFVALYHGTSGGTEFLRIYAPVLANETVTFTQAFNMPDRGALNNAITAKLSAALGTNGEYSVNVHAYKTAS